MGQHRPRQGRGDTLRLPVPASTGYSGARGTARPATYGPRTKGRPTGLLLVRGEADRPRRQGGPAPHPHPAPQLVVGADIRAVPHHRAVQDRPRADPRTRPHQRVRHHRPRLDDRTRQNRAALHARPRADDRALCHHRAAGQLRVGGDLRRRQDQAVAAAAGDGGGRGAAEDQVRRAAYEGRRGAEVEPVRRVHHALEVGAAGQQAGEGLALHRHRPARRDAVDDRAPEHIRARVDLVGDDLLGRLGLLQERRDPPGRVRGDEPERPRVVDPGEVQRDVRAGRAVGVHEGADVQARQDVAVEDQDRLVGPGPQPRGHVADGAARAKGLDLGDVLDAEAERRSRHRSTARTPRPGRRWPGRCGRPRPPGPGPAGG